MESVMARKPEGGLRASNIMNPRPRRPSFAGAEVFCGSLAPAGPALRVLAARGRLLRRSSLTIGSARSPRRRFLHTVPALDPAASLPEGPPLGAHNAVGGSLC